MKTIIFLLTLSILFIIPSRKTFASTVLYSQTDGSSRSTNSTLISNTWRTKQRLGTGLSGTVNGIKVKLQKGSAGNICINYSGYWYCPSVTLHEYSDSSYITQTGHSYYDFNANLDSIYSSNPFTITAGIVYTLNPSRYYEIAIGYSGINNGGSTYVYGSTNNNYTAGDCTSSWIDMCTPNNDIYFELLGTPSTLTPTPTPLPPTVLYSQTDDSSRSTNSTPISNDQWRIKQRLGTGLSGVVNGIKVKLQKGSAGNICINYSGYWYCPFVILYEFSDSNYTNQTHYSQYNFNSNLDYQHGTDAFTITAGIVYTLNPSRYYEIAIGYSGINNGGSTYVYGSTNNNYASGDCISSKVDICTPNKDIYFEVLGEAISPTHSPTPTPTSPPTPSASPTPAPFLDLPWDYQAKGKSFNDAAMAINSYFDHSYPLLSSGLPEDIDGLDNILTFTNSFTDIGYSSHDGYDYGAQAGIIDGDPILAAASGTATVVLAANSHGAGNVIKIDHGNGFQTWYEHLYPDELFVTSENDSKEVQKGQKIGKAGHFGNCWVLDKNGNRIYNTPACAHIHFSVFQDKEKTPDQEADFSDNIPNGVTDPYGWEPENDLQPNLKDSDPWENYQFTQDGISNTGNKSNYLWLTRVNMAAMPMTVDGGEIVLGPNKFFFPPGAYAGNFNVNLSSAPFVNTKLIGKLLKSVAPSIKTEVRNIIGELIKTFFPAFTLTIDFTDAQLYNLNPDTLSIYSSKDGNTWIKETTEIQDHKAIANINHASFFALMGEINDTDPPITNIIFDQIKGTSNWFTSTVTATLNATDNNLGVDYILFKKQGYDWTTYNGDPLIFSDEGNYEIQFYSGDKGGNVEDVKTEKFGIDKTPPISTANITNGTKGNNDWYVSDVSIELTASDEASGISGTKYSLDNGQTYQKYADPITIQAEGINKLMFYSEDNAGNKEDAQEMKIKIDKTPPDTLLSLSWTKGGNDWYGSAVLVTLNATDNTSGSPIIFYKLDNENNFTSYSDTFKIEKEGTTTITYYSIDEAGSKEDAKIREIKIDLTPPEAEIRYDLATFDTQIFGKDSLGEATVSINKTAPLHPKYTITDQAGNTLILNTDKIKLGKQVALSINNLQYNTNPAKILDKNVFFTLVLTNKKNIPQKIDQYYSLKNDKKIFTNYSSSNNLTKIYTKTPGSTTYTREDKAGIILLQLITEKGNLKYSY